MELKLFHILQLYVNRYTQWNSIYTVYINYLISILIEYNLCGRIK